MDASLWLAVGLVFFLAGAVKGLVGLGLPTLAMGLLSVFMPPVSAAGLMLVPSLVTNAWQLATGPSVRRTCERLWPLGVGIVVGTLFGALPTLGRQSEAARPALGAALLAYAIFGMLDVRMPKVATRHEGWLSVLVGYVTGTVTAATGVFVLPAVPYLQALRLPKDDLVQALGLSFTLSTLSLAVQLASHVPLGANLVLSSAAVVPAVLGMLAGQALRAFCCEQRFRRAFFASLGLLGLHMLIDLQR
jgi:uncharacterized membrane protein YfcA